MFVKKSGVLFTKLTYEFDLSFGNFLLWNTLNFKTLNYNCYSLLPSLNYKSSQEMKILGDKTFQVCYFEVLNFGKTGISLSEHFEWGPKSWFEDSSNFFGESRMLYFNVKNVQSRDSRGNPAWAQTRFRSSRKIN